MGALSATLIVAPFAALGTQISCFLRKPASGSARTLARKSDRMAAIDGGDSLSPCSSSLFAIEGKRCDWLSPSTKWDSTRDQLARNVEAGWLLARKEGKDYRVLLCPDRPFRGLSAARRGDLGLRE
jgi:hypothetical protein